MPKQSEDKREFLEKKDKLQSTVLTYFDEFTSRIRFSHLILSWMPLCKLSITSL
jgi:hypothetical protein